MSLDDRQHVEAVAIVRSLRDLTLGLCDQPEEVDAVKAADVWLRENHPSPEVYVAALRGAA